ncbi:3'-5' exonuclease [Candidatus Saccharibacteria bacterium]|nr:3'-5' exonuclease [Candidatus Saccharibacteria bacterium]
MKFKKDILMIDFETTDGRPAKAKPIQLAAILLDKDTLAEKKEFSSYIHQDMTGADPRSSQVHGITEEMLKDAPSQNDVMQSLLDTFGTKVFISCWTTLLDMRMLENMLDAIGHDFMEYDYHVLDVWAIAYTELVKQGKGNISNSVHTFAEFGLPPRGSHDALEDCRHAAEVLRKIML